MHPDLDLLQDFHDAAQGVDAARLRELSSRFSDVLFFVRIGRVWKRTGSQRLRLSEDTLARHLWSIESAGDSALRILDLGASDGTTTVSMLERLQRRSSRPVSVTMSDLYLELHRYGDGWLREYRTPSGQTIFVKIGWLGMRLPPSRHRLAWITCLPEKLYSRFVGGRTSLVRSGTVPLYSPLVSVTKEIPLQALDALEFDPELEGRFHAIRASNILQFTYFAADELSRIAANLFRYLVQGGLLLISRNVGEHSRETEQGSLWRKNGHGFEHLEDFGGGAECRELFGSFLAH